MQQKYTRRLKPHSSRTQPILSNQQPNASDTCSKTIRKELLLKSFTHATPPKFYRINQPDVYNYVRSSVSETFKRKNSRNYDLIQDLTAAVDNMKKKEIDRLCKKYSIAKSSRKKKSFEDAEINVEEITCEYVKSRSKEKQREQNRNRLKKDVEINYKYGRNPEYDQSELFFSFEGNQLKALENKTRQAEKAKRLGQTNIPLLTQRRHPYLEIYEKAQIEAISKITAGNSDLQMTNDYPSIPQPEDWERNSQNIQKIINGIPKHQKRRRVQSANLFHLQQPKFYLS